MSQVQMIQDTLVYGTDTPDVSREPSPQPLDQPYHQPTAPSQVCEPREVLARATSRSQATADRDDLPQNAATVGPTLRRRRVTLSPPTQRRSQFASITEKFLGIEEQRLALERRMVEVLESHVETERTIALANHAIGEGLKALAEILNKY